MLKVVIIISLLISGCAFTPKEISVKEFTGEGKAGIISPSGTGDVIGCEIEIDPGIELENFGFAYYGEKCQVWTSPEFKILMDKVDKQ